MRRAPRDCASLSASSRAFLLRGVNGNAPRLAAGARRLVERAGAEAQVLLSTRVDKLETFHAALEVAEQDLICHTEEEPVLHHAGLRLERGRQLLDAAVGGHGAVEDHVALI